MKTTIKTEAIIAGKYPLYASRFTNCYGSGYVFEGRDEIREELQELFPRLDFEKQYDPQTSRFDFQIPERFNSDLFRTELRQFLRASRDRAFLLMYNTFDGRGEFGMDPALEGLLPLDDRKEFGLGRFMSAQGNIRGVPIGSPVENYREVIDKFTTKAHPVEDNLLYVLASQMNTGNDCLAGVAPILFDNRLKQKYPKDALILAKKYLPVTRMNAENYKATNLAHLWQTTFEQLKREYKLK